MADPRAGWDADDQAALALELRLASRASAPVRADIAALTAVLIAEAAKASAANPDGTIPPKRQAAIRALFVAAVAKLSIDMTAAISGAVVGGVRLALRQEATVLAALGDTVPHHAAVLADVQADPVLARAARDASAAFAAERKRIREYAASAPLRTGAQVRDLAARAGGAARVVERDVRTAANRAINTTTLQLVESVQAAAAPPAFVPAFPLGKPRPAAEPTPILRRAAATTDLRVVWIAERGACLTCLALSGQVADSRQGLTFDEFATFDRHPMPVWPPHRPLMGPPRHPNCRCRLRIIAATNTMLPAALAREARRSVARGFSDYASRPARLGAADRLLAAGMRLPVTVEHRAARDVARGVFSTRHRPRAPEFRAD